MGPTKEAQLVAMLKTTRKGTAPGPDGQFLTDISEFGYAKLGWVINKILAQRINQACPPPIRQKGFRSEEGSAAKKFLYTKGDS